MTLPVFFILVLIFPFTKILPLNSYNQPYGFVLALLIILLNPGILRLPPQQDRWALGGLAFMGTIGFIGVLPWGINMREINYLISYLSPFLMVPVVYWIALHHTQRLKQLITAGIMIWIAVAVVQTVVSPTFLTFLVSKKSDLGLNLIASGRGVLSLAPEPTHHGFQMVILAACLALLNGSRLIILMALAAALVLARSSSVFVVLGMGIGLWVMLRPIHRIWLIASGLGAMFFIGALSQILSDDYRITQLLFIAFESHDQIIFADVSTNMRFSGMVMPLYYTIQNGLLPIGLSWEAWLNVRETLLAQHSWIYDLSHNGPASGFGLYILQLGIFALLPVFIMFKRLTWDHRHTSTGMLTAAVFFTFLGQLYLATPSFSLIYGITIWRLYHNAQQKNAPAEPTPQRSRPPRIDKQE